jgi:TatA/E family protein of Tat protein translocase
MFDLGTKDLVLIAVILVLLFGAKKIPDLTKGIVEAFRHLRGAFKDEPEAPAASVAQVDPKKRS